MDIKWNAIRIITTWRIVGAISIVKYYRAITESFTKVLYGSERYFQLRGNRLVILCHISTKDTLLFNSGCQKSLALYNGASERSRRPRWANFSSRQAKRLLAGVLGFLLPKQSRETCTHKSHVPRSVHSFRLRKQHCKLQIVICNPNWAIDSNLFFSHILINFFPATFYIVIKLFERMAKILSRRGNSLLIVAAVSLVNNTSSNLVASIRAEAALLRQISTFAYRDWFNIPHFDFRKFKLIFVFNKVAIPQWFQHSIRVAVQLVKNFTV